MRRTYLWTDTLESRAKGAQVDGEGCELSWGVPFFLLLIFFFLSLPTSGERPTGDVAESEGRDAAGGGVCHT